MTDSFNNQDTRKFKVQTEKMAKVANVLEEVYQALLEKGYNPVNQIVGYILSGDPAFITSHKDARTLIRNLERDELIEELVRHYLER